LPPEAQSDREVKIEGWVDNYYNIATSQLSIPNFEFLRLVFFNLWWALSNVVLHVVIEHYHPPGAPGARLRMLGPTGEQRLAPGVGEGLVLAGRGTLHCWEPLAEDERRTMIAIGLAPG